MKMEGIPAPIQEFLNRIKSLHFPRQGYTSEVMLIESERGRFALKKARGVRYSDMLGKEVAVLKSLANTGLPIPKVWTSVETGEEVWVLMDWIEGETVRQFLSREKNPAKREEVIFRFGQILSRIHGTPCPRELKGDRPWLEEKLEEAESNLRKYEVDGTEQLLERLKAKKPKGIGQTLIHGDFTIDNVLVFEGKVTGVIDWSGGAFGDPRYDVALAIRRKPNAFETKLERECFFEGYGGNIIDEWEFNYFAQGLYEFF